MNFCSVTQELWRCASRTSIFFILQIDENAIVRVHIDFKLHVKL